MLPIIPMFIAGALWTYNICKIIERSGSKKIDESSEPAGNEDAKENEGDENIIISNSAEAIKYIKNQQKSSGQKKRDWSGGERYGK